MKWTTKLPDREGYYWHRDRSTDGGFQHPLFVHIEYTSQGLIIWDERHTEYEALSNYVAETRAVGMAIEFSDEPIPEPEEG